MAHNPDITIVPLEYDMIPQAKALVARVFKHQDLTERLSFWVYKHRDKSLMKTVLKMFGSMAVYQYWVALNQHREICGTTGLYSEKADLHEALWLSWFCVHPDMRGQGIGKQLIEFSIEEARRRNAKYLRLYTSDDPNEAAAQFLYEQYGFKITRTEKKLTHTIIYRERLL